VPLLAPTGAAAAVAAAAARTVGAFTCKGDGLITCWRCIRGVIIAAGAAAAAAAGGPARPATGDGLRGPGDSWPGSAAATGGAAPPPALPPRRATRLRWLIWLGTPAKADEPLGVEA